MFEQPTKEIDSSCNDFHEKFKTFKFQRKKTIQALQDMCETLNIHRRNVNIATVTGSITSIGGGILVALGLGLTPLTLGMKVEKLVMKLRIGGRGGT